MVTPSVFSTILLLLASRASGGNCGTSGRSVVAPSVVKNTSAATQLAAAVSCDGSFSVEWVGFVTIDTTIVVSENTTLKVTGAADGSSWIDGATRRPLFLVLGGGALHMTGLNLLKGTTSQSYYGGAIVANDSDVTVANCSFVENSATSGGAIFLISSTLTLDDTLFVNNFAAACGDTLNISDGITDQGCYGGAITAIESNVSIINCSFTENKATRGGAIALISSTLILGDTIFFNNFGGDSRGALDLPKITTNNQDYFGGAIYASYSDMTAANCSFIENTATKGGAIFMSSSTLALGDTTFSSNIGADSTGALNLPERITTQSHEGCVGGAIYISYSDTTVVNCSFVANTATRGGAIFMISVALALSETSFSSNSAANFEGVATQLNFGGAIFTNSSNVTTTNCSFFYNNAAGGGGAILLLSSTLDLGGSVFRSNFAADSGGSLDPSGGATDQNYYGGAIIAFEATVSVANCSFIGNRANQGGAIFLHLATLALGGCFFQSNFAADSGGMTYLFYNTTDQVFHGGAIFAIESNLTMVKCSFIGNRANCGGAIVLSSATLALDDTVFSTNFAAECQGTSYRLYNTTDRDFYGGVIFAAQSSISVGNCSFVGNNATYGGVMFLTSTALGLADTTFSNNVAVHSGGAIYGEFGTLVIVNRSVLWKSNSAPLGAAVRLYHFCPFTILGSAAFTNNSGYQGGAVWLSELSKMRTLGSVTFDGNSALAEGGALLVYNGSAQFMAGSTVSFSNNSADSGGAVQQFTGGRISIEGRASFTYNTAIRGGAIILATETTFTVTGEVTMFENVASSSGGAMYCEATTSLELYNTKFLSNYAGSTGGAVTTLSAGSSNRIATFTACSFDNNTVQDAGGAMFIAGGFVGINGSIFTGNSAGRTGGAVLTSGVAVIVNCVFDRNRAYTGPAVSNTVLVSMTWVDFDDNALLCDGGYFLDFASNVSAYDTECSACGNCENCTLRNKDKVRVCEPVLMHTTSPSADGTLESLEVQRGFWRSSSTSKDVRECYQVDACIGGAEHYCASGRTGPYCAVCLDGYARGFGNSCIECSGQRRSAMIAFTAVVVVALVASIVIGIQSLEVDTEAHSCSPRQVLKMVYHQIRRTRASQALKIMVVSWQIVTQFSAVASVTYPEIYGIFLEYVDVFNLNLGWIISVGCLVKTNFYVDLLISTIGPLIVAFIVFQSYRVNKRRLPTTNEAVRSRIQNSHGSILFWVSFLLYATVSSSVFQSFACDDLDNGKSYLRADYRFECYTVGHKIIMAYALVMVVVYPFGIPFCYGLLLYRNRNHLKVMTRREAVLDLAPIKDLWRPYRPEAFFYEVIECLRRVLLSGVVVFFFPNTAGQVATTFLLALFFFALLLILDPYMSQWDSWLARIGHIIVMLSMFVALLRKVDTSDDDSFSQDTFGSILVAANCILIMAVVIEAFGLCFLVVQDMSHSLNPSINQDAVPQAPETDSTTLATDSPDCIDARG